MSSGETNRIHNGRDHLPGISRRFNPQEAITAYKEMVNAENEYYRSDRSKVCIEYIEALYRAALRVFIF
jgi:hypothetical protein